MKDTILNNRPRGFRASGIVLKDNHILLMKQIFAGSEFYNLPGGAWESGETLEDTCKREVKEEFNLNVAVRRLVYILDSPPRMNFVFLCGYLDGKLRLGGPEKKRMNPNDQYHIQWVNVNQLKKLNIRPLPTKKALLKFLTHPNLPTFFVSTQNKINNRILLISSASHPTPPAGYGGIERVVSQVYSQYQKLNYQVDIISQKGSQFHTFSHDQIKKINLNQYRFIISYYYEESFIKYLDGKDPVLYIFLHNNYSPQLNYLAHLKYSILKVLSPAQQQQYQDQLGIKFDIVPNGTDTKFYRPLNRKRTKDIAFIGIIGQHKSPLSCLRYAKRHRLAIDFYGPLGFRGDETAYEKSFIKATKQYPQAKLKGEINDRQKLDLLNQYKYFIFLPGLDKKDWVEPFGLAPLEAMAAGCTVITRLNSGGHDSFCHLDNTIDYREKPKQLNPKVVRNSIKNFDFDRIFKSYYPV